MVIIAIAVSLLVAGAIGALRLGFDTDVRAYFGKDNPERLALEALEDRHGRYNSAILVIAASDGDLMTPARWFRQRPSKI